MGLKIKFKLSKATSKDNDDVPPAADTVDSENSDHSSPKSSKKSKSSKKHKKEKRKKDKKRKGSVSETDSIKKPKLSLKLGKKKKVTASDPATYAERAKAKVLNDDEEEVALFDDEEDSQTSNTGPSSTIKVTKREKSTDVKSTEANSDDELFASAKEVKHDESTTAAAEVVDKKNTKPKASSSVAELYCVCKTPNDDSAFYLGCDGECEGWFHPACVGYELCTRIDHTSGGRSCVKVTPHAHVDTEEGVFTCPSCTRTGYAQWRDKATGSIKEVANSEYYFDKLLRRQLKRDELRKQGKSESEIQEELEKDMESDSDTGDDPLFTDSPTKPKEASKPRSGSVAQSAEVPRKGIEPVGKMKVAKGLKNLGLKQRPHSSSVDVRGKGSDGSELHSAVRAGSVEELQVAEKQRLQREQEEQQNLEASNLIQDYGPKPEGEVTELDFMKQVQVISQRHRRSTKAVETSTRIPLTHEVKENIMSQGVEVSGWQQLCTRRGKGDKQLESGIKHTESNGKVSSETFVVGKLSQDMLKSLWELSVSRQNAQKMRDDLRHAREKQIIESRRQDVEKHRLEAQRVRESHEKLKQEQEAEKLRLQKKLEEERVQQRAQERAERERMQKEKSTMDQGVIMAGEGNLPVEENGEGDDIDEDDWGF